MSDKIRIPIIINQAEYQRNIWSIKIDPKTTTEDILKVEFWAHISRSLRSGDRVEIIAEDNSFFIEVFVMAASVNWAKVVLLRENKLIEDSETVEIGGFSIKWAGRHDKWRVLNGEEVISKGHEDKELASAWLTEHLKTIK